MINTLRHAWRDGLHQDGSFGFSLHVSGRLQSTIMTSANSRLEQAFQ
jgi:hypothetical protein